MDFIPNLYFLFYSRGFLIIVYVVISDERNYIADNSNGFSCLLPSEYIKLLSLEFEIWLKEGNKNFRNFSKFLTLLSSQLSFEQFCKQVKLKPH